MDEIRIPADGDCEREPDPMTSNSAIRNTGIGRSLIAGTMYFAAVFGVGFLLGTVRVLFIEPRTGTRWAELAEMPLMFAAAPTLVLFAGNLLQPTRKTQA